jgi:hypothetical protein
VFQRPKKHLKPTAGNRLEAVQLIMDGLKAASEAGDWDAGRSIRYLREDTAGWSPGQESGVPGATSRLLFSATMQICSHLDELGQVPWTDYRQVVSAAAVGFEIHRHQLMRGWVAYGASASNEPEMFALYGMACGLGGRQFPRSAASMLYQHVQNAEPAPWNEEEDLVAFLLFLTRSHATGTWMLDEQELGAMGNFGSLVSAISRDQGVSEALVQYCDFRLLRSYLFKDASAAKPRKPSDPMFMFEQQWLALFPFELYALGEVSKDCLGKPLSLDVDHPLLKNPLTRLPALWPLTHGPLSGELMAFGQRAFGLGWKPLLD